MSLDYTYDIWDYNCCSYLLLFMLGYIAGRNRRLYANGLSYRSIQWFTQLYRIRLNTRLWSSKMALNTKAPDGMSEFEQKFIKYDSKFISEPYTKGKLPE